MAGAASVSDSMSLDGFIAPGAWMTRGGPQRRNCSSRSSRRSEPGPRGTQGDRGITTSCDGLRRGVPTVSRGEVMMTGCED